MPEPDTKSLTVKVWNGIFGVMVSAAFAKDGLCYWLDVEF